MTVLVVLVFVAVGVVAYIAYRNAQDFSEANEIVPGVATRAPGSWAGAHHPAARMHRRLRDCIDALRANASLDDPAMAPVRAELEQQALAVDDRLVAVNELPRATRDEPLQQVEKAVQAIEQAVASVVDLRGPSLQAVEQGIEAVEARMAIVHAARDELEALSTPGGGLDALRAELDLEPDPRAGERTDPDEGNDDDVRPTDGGS